MNMVTKYHRLDPQTLACNVHMDNDSTGTPHRIQMPHEEMMLYFLGQEEGQANKSE